MQWAAGSGPAIGSAISATSSGICLPTAGFEESGDLFLYFLFPSGEIAMKNATASMTNETVIGEIAKLETARTVRLVDAYTVMNPADFSFEVGQSFSNWNIIVQTEAPADYVKEINAFQQSASKNGFGDIAMVAYGIDTGVHAGKVMASIQAPSADRLGAFMDARGSDWAKKHLKKFSKIREYKHGYMMECRVIQAET